MSGRNFTQVFVLLLSSLLLFCNAPINCMPHYLLLGQWLRKGWDLSKQKFKCRIIWESEFIKSQSIPVSERQLSGDLIKPKVKFPIL